MHAACIHSLAVFCQNSSGNVCTDTKPNTETCASMSKVIASFCSHISVGTPRYTMLQHLLIKCSGRKKNVNRQSADISSIHLYSNISGAKLPPNHGGRSKLWETDPARGNREELYASSATWYSFDSHVKNLKVETISS